MTKYVSLLVLFSIFALIAIMSVEADVKIGSCNQFLPRECIDECKARGYKGGHCGSFLNWNCWCEQ